MLEGVCAEEAPGPRMHRTEKQIAACLLRGEALDSFVKLTGDSLVLVEDIRLVDVLKFRVQVQVRGAFGELGHALNKIIDVYLVIQDLVK